MENTNIRQYFGSSRFALPVGIIVLILLIVFAGARLSYFYGATPNPNQYQAIFLANDQVYFGKLTLKKRQYELRDIYYLQTGRSPQPKAGEEPEIKLIKLGDELHGPEDLMVISRDQIRYWENLKDSSRVTDGIKRHKAQQAAAPAASAPTTAPAASATGPASSGR